MMLEQTESGHSALEPNLTVSTDSLAEKVSDTLNQFAAEIIRFSATDIMRLLRREELSLPRSVALMFVERQGTASVSAISDYLNLALGTTSRLVDQLVCAEYVTRTEDPTDRRLKLITLAPKGQALMREIRQLRIMDLAQHLERLPPGLLANALLVMSEVLDQLHADETESILLSDTSTDGPVQ